MKISILKLSVSVCPAPAPALLNCHFDDFLLFIGPDLAQDHELSCKDIWEPKVILPSETDLYWKHKLREKKEYVKIDPNV